MKRYIYNIRSMQRALLFALLQLFAVTAFAYDFEVDGIYYNILSESEVEVTYRYNDDWRVLNYEGKVVIPQTVTFDGVTRNVTKIGDGAFLACKHLTSVTIPDGVTVIGDTAFLNCESFTSITIPNSVTSIGFQAFLYCTSLATVTIPNSVTSIGFQAFKTCRSLTSVTIPGSVQTIGYGAFCDCDKLTAIEVDEENQYFTSKDGVLFTKDMTEIRQFPGGHPSRSYVIPDGVNKIANSAFNGCSLSSVVISDGVTDIGNEAFLFCGWLTSVVIPNSVKDIGDWAFGVSGLRSIEIPNSVISIGSSAFSGCQYLISVTVPSGVQTIGSGAFANHNLTTIEVDEQNQYFVSKEGVLFTKDMTELRQYPGGHPSNSYVIPDGVKSIDAWAFYDCCLTSILLPDAVTLIGEAAFLQCLNLSSINIPSGVTSIEDDTFYDCRSLTSIVLPAGLSSIGEGAFYGCSALTNVTNLATIPQQIAESTFENYNATLHVKNGLRDTYASAPVWQKFATITDDADGDPTPAVLPDFFEYDGLYYNKVSESTVAVAPVPSNVEKYSGDIVVPTRAMYEGAEAEVVGIGYEAFQDCPDLLSVSMPESVTSIGAFAFSGSTNLTSINIPSGVTIIADHSFQDCNSLTSMVLPDSLSSIGGGAFYGCIYEA